MTQRSRGISLVPLVTSTSKRYWMPKLLGSLTPREDAGGGSEILGNCSRNTPRAGLKMDAPKLLQHHSRITARSGFEVIAMRRLVAELGGFGPKDRSKFGRSPSNLADLGRNWANFGRIRPKLGQSQLNFNRLRPKLADVGRTWPPNVGRPRPTSGKIGPKPVEPIPISFRVAKSESKLGDLARCRPDFSDLDGFGPDSEKHPPACSDAAWAWFRNAFGATWRKRSLVFVVVSIRLAPGRSTESVLTDIGATPNVRKQKQSGESREREAERGKQRGESGGEQAEGRKQTGQI